MVTPSDFQHIRGNRYATPEWIAKVVNEAMEKEGVEGRPVSISQQGARLTVKFANKTLDMQW